MKDIREYIKEKGGTIVGLAKFMGVSVQTVHYHLNRGEEMSVSEIHKICDYLKGDIRDLFPSESASVNCPCCGAKLQVAITEVK